MTTGSVTGTVIDPSGRPIPGATVVAVGQPPRVDPHGGQRRARGDIASSIWPRRSTTSSAAARGFERVQRPHVQVAVDSHLRLDFRLPVAGIVQTVEVTAPLVPIAD
ncbi:MAG: carboxypeptidase-like regulatory domain-containing protein [Comamonadaceae bacterium]|nr:carboxypeptidase-like regulatory domain-containing protein [Comamonadaceae bacterium]